jgi:methionine synthase I (cobalamin-dependent)
LGAGGAFWHSSLQDISYMNIQELLCERILVLDGAMGTVLQSQQLTAGDFGGV